MKKLGIALLGVVALLGVMIGAMWPDYRPRVKSFAPPYESVPSYAANAASLRQFIAGLQRDGVIVDITVGDTPTVNYSTTFFETLRTTYMRFAALRVAWRWCAANQGAFGGSDEDLMIVELDGRRVGVFSPARGFIAD